MRMFRLPILTIVLLMALATLGFGQAATHVVISEVSPMNGSSSTFNTGEFIELYNPLSTPVTFGSNVTIVSGNTSGTNNAEWQLSLSGVTIQAFGFYLIGDGGTANRDASFPANKNLSNSGIRSCVQLRDGATVIDAFGWDPALAPTLPAEGTRFTPSSTSSDGKSFERKSGPLASAPDTLGNAWDSDNNSTDFFQNVKASANPQNSASPIEVNPYASGPTGSGAATIGPALWSYSSATDLRLVFRATTDTIRAVRFTRPPLFSWNTGTISTSPSCAQTVSGDTVTLRGFALGTADSIAVTIPGVTSADSTDEFQIAVMASTDSTTFLAIGTQPKTLVYGTPRSMQSVKKKEVSGVPSYTGKWVVVRGIVTVANEFAKPAFVQDSTAGIAVYDSTVASFVQRGDDIVVLGLVAPFNELFELTPAVLLQKISEGNRFDTLTVTAAQVNGQATDEPYEGRLLRIQGITSVTTTGGAPASSWAVTGSGTNYKLIDGSGQMEVRVSSRINLANMPIAGYPFDMVGVLSQFNATYQIQPRSYEDIITEGQGPRILSAPPYESNITASGLTISWTTDSPGSSIVRYGTTSAYGTDVTDTTKTLVHSVPLTGLAPATVYHVQFASQNESGTTSSQDYIVSTASLTSSGTINVFFNKSVKTSLARGETAQGLVDFPAKAIARIDSAKYTIDVCLYSLSGTAGANIASHLVTAYGRGVKVRMVGEKDNIGTAPWTTLKGAGIPVIDDAFDATNGGAGLMHNKFFVIDNRDTASDTDDWLITGSWNATDPGSNDDMQNIVEVQDKALANAYTVEFNEMWGSATDVANASNSRFGARKYDNTPHLFNIKGTPVEQYFSPSDRTTSHIISAIQNAQYSVGFCLLTVTRSDIAAALIAKKTAGIRVHGVVDNKSDTGTQVDTLISHGIDARIDVNSALLHHKYAVIDAEGPGAPGVTVTGSHNWSSSAENSNNENTLIIRSNRIANLYLQEFAQRYQESGGVENVTVGVEQIDDGIPTKTGLEQNYPNPFNPTTGITYQVSGFSSGSTLVSLKVFDLLGREVATLVNAVQAPGTYRVSWNASSFSSGVYFYRLEAGNVVESKKMLLLK